MLLLLQQQRRRQQFSLFHFERPGIRRDPRVGESQKSKLSFEILLGNLSGNMMKTFKANSVSPETIKRIISTTATETELKPSFVRKYNEENIRRFRDSKTRWESSTKRDRERQEFKKQRTRGKKRVRVGEGRGGERSGEGRS